jgi:hypothetical protein
MTHTKLFGRAGPYLTYFITLLIGANLEDFFHAAIAPLDSLSAWLDPIVANSLSWGDIHTRDKRFESRSNTLEISGVIGAVTKRTVYLRLTLLYLHQKVIKAT